MYSQVSLGVVIKTNNTIKNNHKTTYSNANISGHIAFLGISVGKKIFGFLETGVGSQGAIILGVGYRFNDK